MAEAWLIAQEPYMTSKDLGQNVDEVEKLLKRHEAFEKSTATWEERFSALERLTTVCRCARMCVYCMCVHVSIGIVGRGGKYKYFLLEWKPSGRPQLDHQPF